MQIRLNGEPRQLAPETTLAALVSTLTTATRGIAVAVDGVVVPRSAWPQTRLFDGAQVEVLVATQGG